MINKFLLTFAFLVLAPLTLFWSFTLLNHPRIARSPAKFISAAPQPRVLGVGIFGALPAPSGQTSTLLTSADARYPILESYLTQYQSPLAAYIPQLISTADAYQLDFRLLVAIAQQESNLCKVIPPDSYNCWGWGIHHRGTLKFDNYSQAIDTVAAGLRSNYLDSGLTTPQSIMAKYTPLSSGSWAEGVEQFIQDME
jgi:hypothetical protein